MTFDEDHSRIRDRNAATNLALLKREQSDPRKSIVMKRRRAGWDSHRPFQRPNLRPKHSRQGDRVAHVSFSGRPAEIALATQRENYAARNPAAARYVRRA